MAKVCTYVSNDHPMYMLMCMNSINMLRQYNSTIPIRLYLVEHIEFCNDRHLRKSDLLFGCDQLNVEVVRRPFCNEYFPLHKTYIGENPEESTLFIDTDTFIHGDVAEIFDHYSSHDFTACVNTWAYGAGWNDSLIGMPPLNSGVMLWNRGLKEACAAVPALCETLTKNEHPVARWLKSYDECCYCREEFAFSLYAASQKLKVAHFDRRHAFNIRCNADFDSCKDSIIFHSYNRNWKRIFNAGKQPFHGKVVGR